MHLVIACKYNVTWAVNLILSATQGKDIPFRGSCDYVSALHQCYMTGNAFHVASVTTMGPTFFNAINKFGQLASDIIVNTDCQDMKNYFHSDGKKSTIDENEARLQQDRIDDQNTMLDSAKNIDSKALKSKKKIKKEAETVMVTVEDHKRAEAAEAELLAMLSLDTNNTDNDTKNKKKKKKKK